VTRAQVMRALALGTSVSLRSVGEAASSLSSRSLLVGSPPCVISEFPVRQRHSPDRSGGEPGGDLLAGGHRNAVDRDGDGVRDLRVSCAELVEQEPRGASAGSSWPARCRAFTGGRSWSADRGQHTDLHQAEPFESLREGSGGAMLNEATDSSSAAPPGPWPSFPCSYLNPAHQRWAASQQFHALRLQSRCP
jgi:hypothetical protein